MRNMQRYVALCGTLSFFIVTVSMWTLNVNELVKEYGMRRRKSGIDSFDEKCISSTTDCDLTCLEWTLVLAMGRSGSTTVQQMIAKLPGFNMYGEEGGLLHKFRDIQSRIQISPRGLPWWGSIDKNVTSVACLAQKFYSERHGDTCLHRGCRHGFKEIRYRDAEDISWLKTVFPSAKFVLNYRKLCSNYTDTFGRNCSVMEAHRKSFLKSAENLTSSFHMPREELENLTKWGDLADYLGYASCVARNVTSANTKHGYTKHEIGVNPWVC